MAKTAYPTQSTSHIGRIRHRRNGAKPAKWATNAATKSPTVANTVEPASRPAECEANAVRKIVRLVARTGCRTHILHVSSGLSVDVLRQAKAEPKDCRSARRPVRITSRWIATIFPTTPPNSNAARRSATCASRTRYGRGLPTARWMVSSPIIPRPARI